MTKGKTRHCCQRTHNPLKSLRLELALGMPFWVKLFGLSLENLSNLWQILHLAGLIQLYVYI